MLACSLDKQSFVLPSVYQKIMLFALLLAISLAAASEPIKQLKTTAGDEYGYISQAKQGPLAVILTMTTRSSLNNEFTSIGRRLVDAGFVVASLDLPCHGSDIPGRVRQQADRFLKGRRTGEGLKCWAAWMSDDSANIFDAFTLRVDRVVKDLRARQLVSGDRVVLVGVSRGGYLAMRAAAQNPLITDVIGLAPVTDLQALTEFTQVNVDQAVYGLGRHATTLAQKRLFLQVGSSDMRVGTRAVLKLVDTIIDAGGGRPVDLTLIVTPDPGHQSGEHDRAAQWVLEGFRGLSSRVSGNMPAP